MQPPDSNLFFKQATLLICSSLDIEIALWRCRQFISQYLPADEIYLNIYEPAISGLRYIAWANASGGHKMERSIKLSGDLIQAIESGRRLKDYLVINRPQDDPMGRIIQAELALPDCSFIALRLIIEGRRLGVIDLFAHGLDRFSEADARLFALLREPFAIAMANALKHQQVVELKEKLASDNRYLNSELISQSGDEVVGANGGLKEVMEKVGRIAHLKNTILIMGETGTGKEVVANAIHRLSPRKNEAFIKVNCGAIPEQLIDSELFGHEKGAFTGAVAQKRGRFERAHKGTIFLDEIGELPPWAQVRLLRVLQTQEIERVGGSPPIKLDIRVIVATHRDLKRMVDEGTFREDLWFRINAFPIHIPPLRQRVGDIPLLAAYFLKRKSREMGIFPPPEIAPQAIDRLTGHSWPGNVRELENAVERALIQHRHGPLNIQRLADEPQVHNIPLAGGLGPQPASTLNEVMRHHIEAMLEQAKGKINGTDGAAALLGLHPNTLRNRMQKLGIAYGRQHRSKFQTKHGEPAPFNP
jgi:transcriptional regulator with GAF, ATPase, and Fis domain